MWKHFSLTLTSVFFFFVFPSSSSSSSPLTSVLSSGPSSLRFHPLKDVVKDLSHESPDYSFQYRFRSEPSIFRHPDPERLIREQFTCHSDLTEPPDHTLLLSPVTWDLRDVRETVVLEWRTKGKSPGQEGMDVVEVNIGRVSLKGILTILLRSSDIMMTLDYLRVWLDREVLISGPKEFLNRFPSRTGLRYVRRSVDTRTGE